MSVERRQSAKRIFLDALERAEADRAAWIAAACGSDAALRRDVESLLKAHEQASDFMEAPLVDPAALDAAREVPDAMPGHAPSAADEELPGARIGAYRLLEPLGEGGFGTVHLAEQTDPVRRQVALKILRLGMDSREITARFEAERQALAVMSHPNIATVFDGGTTPTGRPYFVMEFVAGLPITAHADRDRLGTVDRLLLFVDVCAAVQHAHQKGIVHRDLKPSNVLVSMRDGDAVPKVIDFGIAKATDAHVDGRGFRTELRQLVGTPEYMSPEQAESSHDIDTRSDIYALGVLLYELLTGTTPFDAARLRGASFGEIQRIIREEDPPRPSTRVGALGGSREIVAGHRRTDAAALARALKGDLDWIVMRCLEKDRTRRYATANDLAMDIRRHLDDEPVLACPPRPTYLIAKYARRHRVALTVASFFLLTLVASTVVGWGLFADARRARAKADSQTSAAVAAQAHTQAALRQSMLGEARALRFSTLHDRRARSLRLIGEAAATGATPALRSEAIAALAMADIEIAEAWRAFDPPWAILDFDPQLTRWALAGADGSIAIRRVDDRALVGTAPEIGLRPAAVIFGRDRSRLLVKYLTPGPGDPDPGNSSPGDGVRFLLWNLDTDEPILDLMGAESHAAPTFDRGSARVAVPIDARRIRVLDAETGDRIGEIESEWPVICLRLDSPGKRVAIGAVSDPRGSSAQHMVYVHDVHSGALLHRIPLPERIRRVAWTDDGSRIAAACGDFRAYLCDLDDTDNGAARWPDALVGHQAEVVDAVFSEDGRHLMTSSWDNTTRLWDTTSLRELSSIAGYLESRPFFDDDALVPFRRRDGTVGLWRVVLPDRIVAAVSAHPDVKGPRHADVAPDGRTIVTCADDGVRLWGLPGGTPARLVETGSVSQAIFHRTPQRDWILTCGPTGLLRWPLEAPAPGPEPRAEPGAARTIPLGAIQPETIHPAGASTGQHVRWVARTDDGRHIVYSGRNVPITVRDEVTGDTSRPFGDRALEGRFAISPDGGVIAWSDVREGVVVSDLRRGVRITAIPAKPAAEVAFSPCGAYLVLNTDELTIHRTADWSLVGRRQGSVEQLPMRAIAISPDSRFVAAVVELERIILVDLATASTIATMEAPVPIHLNWLAFSPDGAHLISVGWHVMHIWKLADLRRELADMGLDW